MKEFTKDLIAIEDVRGAALFSFDGEVILQESLFSSPEDAEKKNWLPFMKRLDGVREVNLIFEKGKLYVRRTDLGYLMVLTGSLTPLAKLRIHCDLLLPTLAQMKTKGELKNFLKKGR